MVPFVPVDVAEATVIGLVLDNLVSGQLGSLLSLDGTLNKPKNLLSFLGPQRRAALIIYRDRWSHLSKDCVGGSWHKLF